MAALTETVFDDKGPSRTIGWDFYTSDTVLKQEEQLFRSSWQLVGHEKQLANAGDFVAVRVCGRDYFLIRQDEETINCFANVCPHRGHQLVTDCGNKSRITCPYHAWTFTRDGRLMGRPQTASTEPVGDNITLHQIPVDTLAGFLFINPNAHAAPLREFAAGIEDQIHKAVPNLDSFIVEDGPALGHTYECRANWKVLVDNYLECHHCGVAHESFDDLMNLEQSSFELFENYTYQVAPTDRREQSKAFPLHLENDITVGNFWFLFPNTMLGQFPGVPGFYASRLDAIAPNLTHRQTWSLTVPEPLDEEMSIRHQARSEWSVNVVSQEDRALCESVQRGMEQGAFDRGWYVIDPGSHRISEHAMQHFHQMYLSAMDKR